MPSYITQLLSCILVLLLPAGSLCPYAVCISYMETSGIYQYLFCMVQLIILDKLFYSV